MLSNTGLTLISASPKFFLQLSYSRIISAPLFWKFFHFFSAVFAHAPFSSPRLLAMSLYSVFILLHHLCPYHHPRLFLNAFVAQDPTHEPLLSDSASPAHLHHAAACLSCSVMLRKVLVLCCVRPDLSRWRMKLNGAGLMTFDLLPFHPSAL